MNQPMDIHATVDGLRDVDQAAREPHEDVVLHALHVSGGAAAVKATEDALPLFLILSTKWSRSSDVLVWWGPNRSGYTVSIDNSGRYTDREVRQICRATEGAVPVLLADALALSYRVVACDSDKVERLTSSAAHTLESLP